MASIQKMWYDRPTLITKVWVDNTKAITGADLDSLFSAEGGGLHSITSSSISSFNLVIMLTTVIRRLSKHSMYCSRMFCLDSFPTVDQQYT